MIGNKIEVTDVLPLVEYFKTRPQNLVGGNLHIYLSDGNIEKEHIKFCLKQCIEKKDLLGEAICRLSLKMSITQRKKLYESF